MAELIRYIPYIYDLLAVILLLYYIHQASQRGFVGTILNFAGYLVALAVAWPVAGMLARAIFDTGLRDGLVEKVGAVLAEHPVTAELADSAVRLLEALPAYVAGAVTLGGYSVEELAQRLAQYSEHGAELVVDEVLAPIVLGMLTMVLFLVLFSVLLCIVKNVVRFFYGVRYIPLVGPLNSILGGLMGLCTGVICLYVLFSILQFVFLLTGNSLRLLNQELLEQTYSYRLLLRFDPFSILS